MTQRLLIAAAALLALTACGTQPTDPPVPVPLPPSGGYCYTTPDGAQACEYADGTDVS